MSRNTVFRYKGQATDLQKVGQELHVRAILTGRLIQTGDELLISVNLEDVQNSRQIWGEQYNRKLSSLVSVQQENRRGHLRPLASAACGRRDEAAREAPRPRMPKPISLSAGPLPIGTSGPRTISRRLRISSPRPCRRIRTTPCPTRVLPIPIVCWATPAIFRRSEGLAKAKAAAMQALDIDDSLAEAHTSLVSRQRTFRMDWAGAERRIQRAIELNPNSATAHHWYGDYLANMSRLEEGTRERRKRWNWTRSRPSPIPPWDGSFYLARQNDQAVDQLRKVLEIDPKFLAGTAHPRGSLRAHGQIQGSCRRARKVLVALPAAPS